MSEIVQWQRPDKTFLQTTHKELHEKLMALKCSELRAIARAMKSKIKYWTMSKNTLANEIINWMKRKRLGETLPTQDAVNAMCDKLGLWNRLRLNNVPPIDGLVCAAVDLARQEETKVKAMYETMTCGKDQERPVWSLEREYDCSPGFVKLPDGCCVRIGDYVKVWDPDKMTAQCEGCQDLSKESRDFLVEQANQARGASKSLDADLNELANDKNKEGKLILETFQQIQRICIFKMGSAFDEELASKGVTDEVACEDESLITRIANATLGALRVSIKALFKVLQFGMGALKFALGNSLVTLASWGQKMATFILTNPESAKVMLASAKMAKRKLAVAAAGWLDENGYLKEIEIFVRKWQVPASDAVAQDIAAFQGTEAEWIKSQNAMNALAEEKKKRSALAAAGQSIAGAVTTVASDTMQFMGDTKVGTAAVHKCLQNVDWGKMAGRAGASLGKLAGKTLGGIPLVGGFLEGTLELGGELFGEVVGEASKDAIAISVYQSNVMTSLELLMDLINPFSVVGDIYDIVYKYPFTMRFLRSLRAGICGMVAKIAGGTFEDIKAAIENDPAKERDMPIDTALKNNEAVPP